MVFFLKSWKKRFQRYCTKFLCGPRLSQTRRQYSLKGMISLNEHVIVREMCELNLARSSHHINRSLTVNTVFLRSSERFQVWMLRVTNRQEECKSFSNHCGTNIFVCMKKTHWLVFWGFFGKTFVCLIPKLLSQEGSRIVVSILGRHQSIFSPAGNQRIPRSFILWGPHRIRHFMWSKTMFVCLLIPASDEIMHEMQVTDWRWAAAAEWQDRAVCDREGRGLACVARSAVSQGCISFYNTLHREPFTQSVVPSPQLHSLYKPRAKEDFNCLFFVLCALMCARMVLSAFREFAKKTCWKYSWAQFVCGKLCSFSFYWKVRQREDCFELQEEFLGFIWYKLWLSFLPLWREGKGKKLAAKGKRM